MVFHNSSYYKNYSKVNVLQNLTEIEMMLLKLNAPAFLQTVNICKNPTIRHNQLAEDQNK